MRELVAESTNKTPDLASAQSFNISMVGLLPINILRGFGAKVSCKMDRFSHNAAFALSHDEEMS
jgi:hypothetical protein